MNGLLCLEKFPALAWKLFMRTGLALISGLGLPQGWGTQETRLVLRGAQGSPKAGIKTALCRSLQRLLGLPGTQTPLCQPGASRGGCFPCCLRFSVSFQLFPWGRPAAVWGSSERGTGIGTGANTGVLRAPGRVLASPGVIGACSRSPALAPAVIGGFPVPPLHVPCSAGRYVGLCQRCPYLPQRGRAVWPPRRR